jgi:hypothetical protein
MPYTLKTVLYCTLCGEPLAVLDYDTGEGNFICSQGHKWWYSPVELVKGNFLVFSAGDIGFQCDSGYPHEEAQQMARMLSDDQTV